MNIVIPIIKKLLQEEKFEPIVIGLTTAVINLKKNDIKFYRLIDLLDWKDKKEAFIIGNKLAKRYHNFNSGLNKIDSVSYLGPSMYDLILRHGKQEAHSMFKENGRKSFMPIYIMKQILNKLQPDVIITTCGKRAEKAAVLASQRLDIKTIRIIDGFGNDFEDNGENYIAVLNDLVKDNLIDKGINQSKIHVTGQPAFESLFQVKNSQIKKLKNKLNLNDEKPVITWASQKIDGISEVLIELLEIFKEFPEKYLIVKLHPNENGVIHQKIIKNYNLKNVYLIKKENIHSLIQMSNVIITQYSTVGIEAILADKPLIVIDFLNESYDLPYLNIGAAKRANTKSELRYLLDSLLNQGKYLNELSKARKKFLMPKSPTDNIVKLIKNIDNY